LMPFIIACFPPDPGPDTNKIDELVQI